MRYLILSDLHLCDVEDHPDGWKAYKASRYLFDASLDELLTSFVAAGPGAGELTLILNGDIFDFDLVTAVPAEPAFPVSPGERVRGLQPTEPKSIWRLERILAHHPTFVASLARVLAAGHRIVYVLGNHDREVHFPGVQAALVAAISRAGGGALPDGTPVRLQFEDWFFLVPGELYVEHGNQYDHYASYRYVLAPTVTSRGDEEIAVPMGNLSNRYLGSGMGFFNPHSGDFLLSVFSYLAHWWRHYAFTRRSLVLRWMVGSLLVLAKLVETKGKAHRAREIHAERLAEQARRAGVPLATVLELDRLQRPPIATKLFRVIHEFWIDRVALVLLMLALTFALAVAGIPLWVKLVVPLAACPLSYLVYDWAVRGDTLYAVEKEIPRYAEAIARRLGVRVVSFGHTHIPQLVPLARGVVFVNSGTWAPITRTTEDRRLAPGYRNYVLLGFDGGRAAITLDSWLPGDDLPERGADVIPLGTPASDSFRPLARPEAAAR